MKDYGKQKFRVGDIVRHQETSDCYMITYADTTDKLDDGTKVGFVFWRYLAIPIGCGSGTFPFQSYERDPITCKECYARDVNHDTLEVVISTGLTREQLDRVTF
jgi:hypothetical protein